VVLATGVRGVMILINRTRGMEKNMVSDEIGRLQRLAKEVGLNIRITYKWWIYHIYKKYDDGREHHIGSFPNSQQVKEVIENEIEEISQ